MWLPADFTSVPNLRQHGKPQWALRLTAANPFSEIVVKYPLSFKNRYLLCGKIFCMQVVVSRELVQRRDGTRPRSQYHR